MLLMTTCRKPNTNTRVFSRRLSSLLPDAEYTPRGKKNIHGLIGEARQKGLRRIAIVSDFKGNPGEISFLKLDRTDWDWESTVIKVKSASFERGKERITDIAVEGKLKEIFVDLFDINESDEPDMVVTADEQEIRFGDKMHIKIDIYKKSEE